MSIGQGLPFRACTSIRSISTSAVCQRNCVVRRPHTHGLSSISPKNTGPHVCVSPAQRKTWNVHPASRQFHATHAVRSTKDPYSVLGLGKTASSSDIKKAYYALARKYHPDTNKDPQAKDRFSEAQAAYAMLSDPKKREAWDQFGAAAFDQQSGFDPGPASGTGPFGGAANANGFGFGADINLEDLFGAFTGQNRRGRSSRQSSYREELLVGEDIEVQANISFMSAAKGMTKEIYITPMVKCKTCSGGGLRKGQMRSTCKKCGGTGTQVHFMQQGFQMASTCGACGGSGVVVPRGAECEACNGKGAVRERKAVRIDIPGGVEDGMRIRVIGEGDAPQTGTAPTPNVRSKSGDLYVFIRVASDSKFSRSGADILYTALIPLTTAILGGEIKVPTLDGETIITVPTGTGTGDTVNLRRMGMPIVGSRVGAAGDLRVEFRINMPKYLTTNQMAIVETLADEMGDHSAKRIVNVGKKRSPEASSETASSHKNDGFLKAAWHKLTHQDDKFPPEEPGLETEKVDEEEEPRKSVGSG